MAAAWSVDEAGGGSVKMVSVKGFVTEVRDTNCSKEDEEEGGMATEGFVAETELAVDLESEGVDRLDEGAADVEGAERVDGRTREKTKRDSCVHRKNKMKMRNPTAVKTEEKEGKRARLKMRDA